MLIRDVIRTGNKGIGESESVQSDLSGYWSRRNTGEHRLVCQILDAEVRLAASRHHY